MSPRKESDFCTNATCGRIAELLEHLIGEQGEDGGGDIPCRTLGGPRTRRIPMIDVGQVIEDGEVDDENAHLGAAEGQDGRDPRHAREHRPSKPETHRQQCGLEASKVEPALWEGVSFGHLVFRNAFLEHADDGREDRPDRDAGENCAGFLDVEPAPRAEDERYDGDM
ncbi:hypothetical protein LTR72_011219 [Exophiala xenobiotica]|nr:hypothetical protein LTR72_011219 [Exophiala xenobiotica]KAK5285217.1 hypothetical protein LTR14_011127 [Exophiala xenobiotica]KAK5470058.1 hypothetical protein LTR55_011186 [Exophiala xenobiotica]